MDWRQVIALKPDQISDQNRENLFEALCEFKNYEKIDNRSFKKLFKLAQNLMIYKGEQVTALSSELEYVSQKESAIDDSSVNIDNRSINSENNKLRKIIEKLESEKSQQKIKFKQLTDEIQILQKKLQSSHLNSDREDSPDALSDLEQQKELLTNISLKNKHIKRLLRDVEELETKTNEQEIEMKTLRDNFQKATTSSDSINNRFKDSQNVIKDQIEVIESLNIKLRNMDEVVLEMQKENRNRESEIFTFGKELEKRANLWKGLLDQKQNELESLKVKYEDIIDRHPGYNIDAERADLKRLTFSIKERDCLIKDLEEKLFEMSNELITATDVINKLLVKEKETKESSRKARSFDCCTENRIKIVEAKKQVQDLNELIISLEEDNIAKSRQAIEAIEHLQNYESGKDGLPQAIEKTIALEQKIKHRDKQIKDLIKEINRSQELAKENIAMRQQLGMAEDEIVPTTFIEAKQKKLEKINERLTLKLRASEELRLKLKLEKIELRRQIKHSSSSSVSPMEPEKLEKPRTKSVNSESPSSDHFKEKDVKYNIVVDENENLRIGMHEILHKLRDYDATSNRISIDTEMLEKVLHALDARSVSGWYHPAMRMQNELLVSKEREMALKEQIRTNENFLKVVTKSSQEVPCNENFSQTDFDYENVNFDKKLELIEAKDKEIFSLRAELKSLKEPDQEKSLIIEELKNYKNLFDEFSQTQEDEVLQHKLNQVKDFTTENVVLNRKVEFLLEDNAQLITRINEEESKRSQTIFELRKDFLEKIKSPIQERMALRTDFEPLNIKDALHLILSRKQAMFCQEFLTKIKTEDLLKSIDKENKIQKISVIDQDLLSDDFITKEDLVKLKHRLKLCESEIASNKLERENNEKTLKLYQDQISEQQQIKTRSSEEEISLRHLVVDLQSRGNEQQLLARTQRHLLTAQESGRMLMQETSDLKEQILALNRQCKELTLELDHERESLKFGLENNDIQLRYLKKSLSLMQQHYSQNTPLYFISDFVGIYKNVQEEQNTLIEANSHLNANLALQDAMKKLMEIAELNKNEEKIEIVKYKTKTEYLESRLNLSNHKIEELNSELARVRMDFFNFQQHWETMKLLMTEDTGKSTKKTQDVEVQTEIRSFATSGTNTSNSTETSNLEISPAHKSYEEVSFLKHTSDTEAMANHKSLESQLKQAMILASTRSALLLETENRLTESQGRIKAMERNLEDKEKQLREERGKKSVNQDDKTNDNILSMTIASLQNLLLEKDTRYQELLKSERNDHTKSWNELQFELEKIKSHNTELNRKIKEQDEVIGDLTKSLKHIENPDDSKTEAEEIEEESNKYIDDMFMNESKVFELEEKIVEIQTLEVRLQEHEEEIRKLQNQLREVSNREKMWERNLNEKVKEISMLNDRLKSEFKDVGETISNCRDIEQLKEMLDEKDRHINDLTETLTHFHDDQQKYISDTTLHSAEQMSQLTADLNRSEATNKVLNTQLEALKRQITNLGQREKQARDLVKTLKNQLIRRPVISIKNQKGTTKEEQYQRRAEILQNELTETKEELRKQTQLAETRKMKNSHELNLWEKQKRAQQNADKFKLKLSERETEMEKLKMNLNSCRQTISRLEREKTILEARNQRNLSYCQSPSCPNNHPTSDSPESDEADYYGEIVGVTAVPKFINEASNEMFKALRSRIEQQQRKIVAMELEGKGSNAMAHEMERMQEKVSSLEAQNLRLEAKNLQLQLDNDLMRQGDENERQKRQIKHLEDYILLLKSELSEALAAVQPTKLSADNQGSSKATNVSNMEQTILALKRIVERLRIENKNLKEGKSFSNFSKSSAVPKEAYDKILVDYKKMQNLYAEALNKISANESCKFDSNKNADLKTTEKLEQKTQLLEKAKILLTRAAAKEKNLREQIDFWKRKCADLQNVPVIEEASE